MTYIESGLSYSKKLDSEWRIANGLCDLGFAELGAGRLDEARERFQQAHSMRVADGLDGEHGL